MKPYIETIKGKNRKGKKILLISGTHGSELTPLYTLMIYRHIYIRSILKNIDKITLLHGINEYGIKNNTRNYEGNKNWDLNRSLIYENTDSVAILKKQIKAHDIIIDIHSSANCATFVLIDMNEYTNSLVKWCNNSNVLYGCRYNDTNTIKRYALESNKIGITIETNGLDFIDKKAVKEVLDLLDNLLLNIPKSINKTKINPGIRTLHEIKSINEGLLKYAIPLYKKVVRGKVIAEILDYKGNISKIYSEVDGICICGNDRDYININDIIMIIKK